MEIELEKVSSEPLATADAIAGRFELQRNDALKSDEYYNAAMNNLGFGVEFGDYLAHATWTADAGWHDFAIEPYAEMSLDPAAAVLHYGQEVFEGLKAYRHEDGSVWTFRPSYNGARLNKSSRRLAIPELPIEDFMAAIVDVVRANERWVPSGEGTSLYLRPFIFASEAFLGVRAAHKYEFVVIVSPSGAYFKNGLQPIELWVDKRYHRAGPGGMGDVKTGGNYAASLLPKMEAAKDGFDEVLFLDAATSTNLDELGGMNVFVVMSDGSVKTPELTGNILPGSTRSSILQLLTAQGVRATEETIPLDSLLAGIANGDVAEMFACGTAAVVVPIGRLASNEFDVQVPTGDVTARIYDQLTSIQLGTAEDSFNWLYKLSR